MSLQQADAQITARYVGNVQQKQSIREELAKQLEKFYAAGGKPIELPGPSFKLRQPAKPCEDPEEFCGICKLNKVKAWFNKSWGKTSRRQLILQFTDFTKSEILYIAQQENRTSLTNREFRKILAAIPLVEAEEKRLAAQAKVN